MCLKILYVIDSLRSGGAEKLVKDIAIQIMSTSSEYEIHILLLTDEGNVYDQVLKNHDIEVKVIPLRRIKNPLNVFYIYKELSLNRYDVVHVHLFPATYWVSLANFFLFSEKTKVIMTEHSTYNKRRKYHMFNWIEKVLYKGFNKIVSISESTQKNLMKWLQENESNKKFEVIENGIHIDTFSNSKALTNNEFKNYRDRFKCILCMVGRFTEAKDHDTLLRALSRLPIDYGLVLVGDGPMRNEIEDKIREYNIENQVVLLGYREDIPQILKSIDIVVHSANWEGFGLAAIEGMAAGKPIVASKVEGLKDLVEGAGLLFTPSDDLALSNCIIRLSSNNKFYEEVAKKCMEAAKKYDIALTTEKYKKIYKQVSIGGD